MNLCLLIIGALDESGQISLKSMEAISRARICIAANDSGKIWLEKCASNNLRERFCFHDDLVDHFELLDLNSKSSYSQYRTLDFRKLTVLKWDLLKDSLLVHKDSNGAFFSDLDIIWLKNPLKEFSEKFQNGISMVVQSDGSRNRPDWICTGVMAWLNSDENILQLEKLRNLQVRQISAGNYQDDEDTFNQYIERSGESLKFAKLPKEGFVVGRDFLNLILQKQGFSRRRIFCFHANYLTGLHRKGESLEAVEHWFNRGTIPLLEISRFILLPRMRQLISKIKK